MTTIGPRDRDRYVGGTRSRDILEQSVRFDGGETIVGLSDADRVWRLNMCVARPEKPVSGPRTYADRIGGSIQMRPYYSFSRGCPSDMPRRLGHNGIPPPDFDTFRISDQRPVPCGQYILYGGDRSAIPSPLERLVLAGLRVVVPETE